MSMGRGLAYGWLSARRRMGEMILPVVTTATGAFLVVLVFGMSDGIRAQSASLGHADEIGRAVVLIAVTVLLVGVVEVAVATTRTVAHRTRELGVLGANGVPATIPGPGGKMIPFNPLKDVAFHALSNAYAIGFLICGISALVAAVIAVVMLAGRVHANPFSEE